jgi:LacI family transcriptional regulator
VALLIETSNGYARGVLAGIAEYVQMHGPWAIYLPEAGRADALSSGFREWSGDGILVRAEREIIAKTVAQRNLPDSPSVHSDVRAESAMAFSHLWERGFRNLAFCGVSDYQWVRWQEDSFCQLARTAGAKVSSYIRPLRLHQPGAWATERKALAVWLARQPKPLGVFACYDIRGQQVLDACEMAGLRIPDSVAVVGVDDDPVRCSLSNPPLSSVAPDTRKVGYMAAELLSKLMTGKRITAGMRFVTPVGVSARRSTDAYAIEDRDVATALRFIREHCCKPITVRQVIDLVALSRRSFETRFLEAVGRTPYAEILRCRMEHTKQMLTQTDLPMKAIAARVGVGTPEYLSVIIRRATGMSPSQYRQMHQ